MYLFNRPFSRKPHPTRTPIALSLLALVLIGISLFATDVAAAHRGITVDFDELDVSVRRGHVTVDYRIERGDWRRLRHAGITPRLYLYAPRRGPDRFLHAVTLNHRDGTVTYPRRVTPDRMHRATFRLVGHRGRVAIDEMRYGSSCAETVTVAVDRRRRRGRRGRGKRPVEPWRAELVKACTEQTYGRADVAACIENGSRLRGDGADVVEACGDATYSSSDLVGCIARARSIARNRVGTIESCSENTYWSDAFDGCLEDVSAYRGNPAPVIEACADATYWSDAFRGCLRDARGLGRGAASVVRACGEGTYWRGAFESCVQAASRRQHG